MGDRRRDGSAPSRQRDHHTAGWGGSGTSGGGHDLDAGEKGQLTDLILPGTPRYPDGTALGDPARLDLSRGESILQHNAADLEDGTTAGWLAQDSATRFPYDTSAGTATGTSVAVAWEATTVYNPPGSLKVTSSATTYTYLTSSAASGVSVTAGDRVRAVIPVLARTAERTITPFVRFYNSSNSLVSEEVGEDIVTDLAVWRFGTVDVAAAPATSTHVVAGWKVTSGGASGDIHFVDEVIITTPTNATISADATNFRSGAYSLAIESQAAGLTLASTPDTGAGTGYKVNAGEFYYFRGYYRQSDGLKPVFIAAFLDDDGVLVSTSNLADAFAAEGSTAFKLATRVVEVPYGATQMSLITGFFATGASQVLNIDDFDCWKLPTIVGGVWASDPEVSDDPSQAAEKMMGYMGSTEKGFPFISFNGHVFGRALHGRLETPTGTQNVTTGSWQTVTMNTVVEAYGMEYGGAGAYYLIVPRTGLYWFGGQLQWDSFFAASSVGIQAIAVERWTADGSTFVKRYVAASDYTGVTALELSQAIGLPGRANQGERIYLKAYQNHGSTIVLNPGAGSIGGSHVLSMTYLGDVV